MIILVYLVHSLHDAKREQANVHHTLNQPEKEDVCTHFLPVHVF